MAFISAMRMIVNTIELLTFISIFAHCLTSDAFSSSVWCSLTLSNTRKCIFTNLYYNVHSSFIFLLTENSILSGLVNRDDLKYMYATSVIGHNSLSLKISIVDKYELIPKNQELVNDAILLHRFKPDNIMHVIHDDLLPLYTTYMELCLGDVAQCTSKYSLFFSDENIIGPFVHWYNAFSKHKPVQLPLINQNQSICFSNIHIGLSHDSVFYQYGYTKPRGIGSLKPRIAHLLHGFRTFLLNYFKISNNNVITNRVVFISRKLNRKILNEQFVENNIKSAFKKQTNLTVEIINTDFSTNSSYDILLAISSSKYLIGMHGAGLFLAMFLPGNSTVIEFFPYGINKESVSPLYAMSQIPGIQFNYYSWENFNDYNTFPHPEYPIMYGGLKGLSWQEKVSILNLRNIPSYRCCSDAVFLSRMYQDTIIDESITTTFTLAFKPMSRCPDHSHEEWFFPASVSNASCIKNSSGVFLSWYPPFNMVSYNNLKYNVHLEALTTNISFTTSALHFHFNKKANMVKIWIMCTFNNVEGSDLYLVC